MPLRGTKEQAGLQGIFTGARVCLRRRMPSSPGGVRLTGLTQRVGLSSLTHRFRTWSKLSLFFSLLI